MIKKNNILLVTNSFYPDGWGGAHTYVYNLAKYLLESGDCLPEVLTIRLGLNSAKSEKIEGFRVVRYNSVLKSKFIVIKRPVLTFVNSYRAFRKLSKNTKFDILSFHSILPAFGIIFLGKIKHIPKIYTFHSSLYEDVLLQARKKKYVPSFLNFLVFRVLRYIEKLVLKKCDKIIVLSNYSKNYLMETYCIRENKIEIIPGGVDTNLFKPGEDKNISRQKVNLPENKIILITTRRLVARMGIENLIYAIKEIVKTKKNIMLLIIGDGFLKEKLQDIVIKENLTEYINFLGVKDSKELPVYYQAADLFIMPSEHSEWFGLSTLEALACGTVALGTSAGATGEILSGLDADLIFKGADILAIRDGIRKFIDNQDKLENIRCRARQYVINNFTWDKMLFKVKNIFLEEIKDKNHDKISN